MHTIRAMLIRNGDLTGFGVFLVTEAAFLAMLLAYAAGAA